MVRAGVVKHPSQWPFGGYREIQCPKRKNVLIDYNRLMDILGLQSYSLVKNRHRELVEEELAVKRIQHQNKWKKSIAEGSRQFVNRVQSKLAGRAIGRKVQEDKTGWQLREPTRGYNGLLGVKYHYRA